jgi:hypothetical protein
MNSFEALTKAIEAMNNHIERLPKHQSAKPVLAIRERLVERLLILTNPPEVYHQGSEKRS